MAFAAFETNCWADPLASGHCFVGPDFTPGVHVFWFLALSTRRTWHAFTRLGEGSRSQHAQDARPYNNSTHRHTVMKFGRSGARQWATVHVQPYVRCDWCIAKSEGEHHTPSTRSSDEQCGRCWCQCDCRSLEGGGFDVLSPLIKGMCLLTPFAPIHN